jgi:predicted transcriptional regulator
MYKMNKFISISSLVERDLVVYAVLIRNPGLNISDISKYAGIERINCYRSILKLAHLNLVFSGFKYKGNLKFNHPSHF